ncbi:MAG: 50S ribosomal protein L21 [Cyanobacteria bacterium]|nr:50S ribosomal protein L21 [Cyanobacteriota bacterium]MDA1021517.1 50S ribosomal protein L21 [Cyanobacteriota bacterium]
MYAIVDINGKQYKAEEGKYIDIDLLSQEPGAVIKFDKVLLVSDGAKSTVGQPIIEGASVAAKVMNNFKSKKIIVYKMRPKKGYRRKQGHRQQYTRIQIEKIDAKVAA